MAESTAATTFEAILPRSRDRCSAAAFTRARGSGVRVLTLDLSGGNMEGVTWTRRSMEHDSRERKKQPLRRRDHKRQTHPPPPTHRRPGEFAPWVSTRHSCLEVN